MIGWQQPLQIDGAPFQLRAIRPLHARLPTVWFRRLVRGRQWEERVVHARSVAGGATPPLRISSQPLRRGASERGGLGGPVEAPHDNQSLRARNWRTRSVTSFVGKIVFKTRARVS